MVKNKIISIFFMVTVLGIIGLLFLFYDNHQFQSTELSQEIKIKIAQKEQGILQKIRNKYGISFKVPIIISNKLPNRNFGMAIYDPKSKKIAIYLNKNRFKESENYMINDVLPHEYAHALMFHFKNFSNRNSGHTKAWQQACINLGGIKCTRFVNHQDIVLNKTNFFNETN